MRRRISMEGNRFAERAVENIVESNEDHEYFQYDSLLYYSVLILCYPNRMFIRLCSGKQYGNTFFGRMGATFGRVGTAPKYPRPSDSSTGGIESNPLR